MEVDGRSGEDPVDGLRIHLALDALVEGIEAIDRRPPCVDLSICITPETWESLQMLYEPQRGDGGGSESQVAPGLLADEERSAPPPPADVLGRDAERSSLSLEDKT